VLQSYTCTQYTIYTDTQYTKALYAQWNGTQWDKAQYRELLVCSCVCIALCTLVAHSIAQNRPVIFPLTLQTISIALMMSRGGSRRTLWDTSVTETTVVESAGVMKCVTEINICLASRKRCHGNRETCGVIEWHHGKRCGRCGGMSVHSLASCELWWRAMTTLMLLVCFRSRTIFSNSLR